MLTCLPLENCTNRTKPSSKWEMDIFRVLADCATINAQYTLHKSLTINKEHVSRGARVTQLKNPYMSTLVDSLISQWQKLFPKFLNVRWNIKIIVRVTIFKKIKKNDQEC